MASVASPAADQATELLQKLSLDSQVKTHDSTEVNNKPSTVQNSAANGNPANMSVPSRDQSLTPLLQEIADPSLCYMPGGYGSTPYYYQGSEWDYASQDGHEALYGDMYGYGYASYGAFPSNGSPVPAMAHDGQLYGPQHFQYPSYYQPTTPHAASYMPSRVLASQAEVSTLVAPDQPPLASNASKTGANGIANGNLKGHSGSGPVLPSPQNTSLTTNSSYSRGASAYQDPRYGYDGMRSPIPWFDGSAFSSGQHIPVTTSAPPSTTHTHGASSGRNPNNHSAMHLGLHASRPTSSLGAPSTGYMNRMYPNNRVYNQYGNIFRANMGFGLHGYDSRTNEHWGATYDNKYRPRGRNVGYYGGSNEDLDGLTELNRGPRAGRFRNQDFEKAVTIAVKGQSLPSSDKTVVNPLPDGKQYNAADLPDSLSDAKFFVIKSYSEDDVHKSVKYNVWASTPNGNKKLDAAYKEAQEKAAGCPIFLFFSVNASGQFVGVAEMVGPVDFEKTVEYWQQDKWTGCFPVKWHVVKDVPNSILKHIILDNNENKPVTNSRDTQEIKLEKGLQMLKIFKEHVSRTSMLDDFEFYEERQKIILDKRAKQQKQAVNAKAMNEVAEDRGKAVYQNGSVGLNSKLAEDVANGGYAKVDKLSSEKRAVANGVSSG